MVMKKILDLIAISVTGEEPVVRKINLPGKWAVQRHQYGVVISEAEFCENEFFITWSPGQSGDVVWSVTLMSIDMGMRHEHGKCKWTDTPAKINKAVNHLTDDWVTIER